MIRLAFSATVLAFSAAVALPAQAASATLPAGTKVTVSLVNAIDSGSAKAGQNFSFQAVEPVTVAAAF